MKRRTFILITTGTLVLSVLPAVKQKHRRFSPEDPLLRPDMLARFCDENEICAIGKSYRQLMPAENDKARLTELLLTDTSGYRQTTKNKKSIIDFLAARIREDFQLNKIHTVNGWVISETEARQCALVSLTLN